MKKTIFLLVVGLIVTSAVTAQAQVAVYDYGVNECNYTSQAGFHKNCRVYLLNPESYPFCEDIGQPSNCQLWYGDGKSFFMLYPSGMWFSTPCGTGPAHFQITLFDENGTITGNQVEDLEGCEGTVLPTNKENSYSCGDGYLCDGTPVTGSPGQVVCGTDYGNWKCTPDGWVSTGEGCSCN